MRDNSHNDPMIDKVSAGILQASHLSADAIEALAEKKILAVRVAGYCGVDVCSHAMRKLAGNAGHGYTAEPDFRKFVGGALFDGAEGEAEILENYLRNAAKWYSACNEVFHPHISPADKMRHHLREVWPAGNHMERIGGRPAFAGLIRGFHEGAEAHPHQDMTHWDLPHMPEAQTLHTQLSCLTYLSCAGSGGELELWASEIENRPDYEAAKVRGCYGLDRERVGPPDTAMTPRVGELIVFNARRIHAVRRIAQGLRCTQSFFIGYRGTDQPLSLFS